MMSGFQYIHEKGIIHRDIKPDNLMLGTALDENQVFIIDFGLAVAYLDASTHTHLKRNTAGRIGNKLYASLNASRGGRQSPRDDMEAVGYVLMHFLRGSLPWEDVPERTWEVFLQSKMTTRLEELCEGFSNNFVKYLEYYRNMRCSRQPAYDHLRRLLDTASPQVDARDVFDWT